MAVSHLRLAVVTGDNVGRGRADVGHRRQRQCPDVLDRMCQQPRQPLCACRRTDRPHGTALS
eukprot:SAG22_NODE_1069_length_5726_cov_20.690954_2_plen_62_part_00